MLPVNLSCATSDTVHWSWQSSLLYARMDKLIGKEVDALRPINLFDLKVIPTFYIKRDRVHTFMHDVCVSRSVCTYDSTYLDEMQVCVGMRTYVARLD